MNVMKQQGNKIKNFWIKNYINELQKRRGFGVLGF